MEISMKKINLFTGERIQIVAITEQDAEKYARWSHDPNYMRSLDTDVAVPHSTEYFQSSIQSTASESNMFEFGIKERTSEELIGFVSLHSIEWNNRVASLAIGIGEKEFRNKGYGTEAVKMILGYAFNELNLNRVGLDVIQNNIAGIKSYEKVGFIKEGVMREAVIRDGQKQDRIYMGILYDEWKKIENKEEE
jgi:RimJ/RimL family protein N-acetyltransferase